MDAKRRDGTATGSRARQGSRRAKDVLGRRGEAAAVRYLTGVLGWTVLDRNWRCRDGELDLVAYDGCRHIVCEVKTRSSLAYGAPVEAVTTAKAARLRRLAARWADEHGVRPSSVRVDVIGLVVTATNGSAKDGSAKDGNAAGDSATGSRATGSGATGDAALGNAAGAPPVRAGGELDGFAVDHLREVC